MPIRLTPDQAARAMDYIAFRRLLSLRAYVDTGEARLACVGFKGVPPEALAAFPPAWVAYVRAGGWRAEECIR